MTYHHTTTISGETVPKVKIAITLDAELLRELDRTVAASPTGNRSQAIEAAVRDRLDRLGRRRLARECALLDPKIERAMADEGLAGDTASWPVY